MYKYVQRKQKKQKKNKKQAKCQTPTTPLNKPPKSSLLMVHTTFQE